jgi:ABC-type transport system involved in multi-copper enzyme maturation permease subunit
MLDSVMTVVRLPLLRKELIELAARGRTYILRLIAGVGLFGFFCLGVMPGDMGASYSHLGMGADVFRQVLICLFVGIYALLPAMMCGAIAGEKERQTLPLLLLTGLTPREILWEKYLSRLVPMLSLMLLSMPLLAIAYSLGGVSPGRLLSGIVALIVSCAQVGALSIMFSAWCNSTITAFISFYTLGALMLAGCACICAVPAGFLGGGAGLVIAAGAFPAAVAAEDPPLWATAVASISGMAIAGYFLHLGARYVNMFSLVPPRDPLSRLLNVMDARLGSYAQGLTRRPESSEGKRARWDRLVAAWHSAGLIISAEGRVLRFILAIEIPVAAIALFSVGATEKDYSGSPLTWTAMMLWGLAALLVSVQSANAFAAERAHQTLDVLLVTPLTGREIVLRKMRSSVKIVGVALVPIATILLAQAWIVARTWRDSWLGHRSLVAHVVVGLVGAAVTLLAFAWLSAWIGLHSWRRERSLVTAVITILAWSFVPLLAVPVILGQSIWLSFPLFASPAFTMLRLASIGRPPALYYIREVLQEWHELWGVPASLLLCAGVAITFILLCLVRADKYLGRIPSPRRKRSEPSQ